MGDQILNHVVNPAQIFEPYLLHFRKVDVAHEIPFPQILDGAVGGWGVALLREPSASRLQIEQIEMPREAMDFCEVEAVAVESWLELRKQEFVIFGLELIEAGSMGAP